MSQLTKLPNLIYIDDTDPGYTRIRSKNKFIYQDCEQKIISDKKEIERINNLVIPPAWKKVWIAPNPAAYLLAVGRDDKNRKQYIYHPEWTAHRQQQKFHRMIDFAAALPSIRLQVEKDLASKKWNKKKIIALIVKVLDEAYIRIGNKQYKKKNNTFGLTTLRRKHIDLKANELTLTYKAKSNKQRKVKIEDKKLIKLIKRASDLPGYEIFRYKDEQGHFNAVDSSEVNAYIQGLSSNDFSCKDFRTWAASSLAVELYPLAKEDVIAKKSKNICVAVIKRVSKKLGNTQAVCKKYYIHPAILSSIKSGDLDKKIKTPKKFKKKYKGQLNEAEQIACYILSKNKLNKKIFSKKTNSTSKKLAKAS